MAYTPSTILPLLEIFQWSTPDDPNPRLSSPVSSTDTTLAWTSAPLDRSGNVMTGNFLMNGKDKRGYTEQIYVPSGVLDYDAQSANFTVGEILLGGTSGARAVIVADTDDGTTGSLVLAVLSGTFQINETITDESTGSATSDGTLTDAVAADGLSAVNVVRGVRLDGLDYTTGDSTLAVDLGEDTAIGCVISPVNFAMMVAAMQGSVGSGGEAWRIGRGEDNDIVIYAENGDANRPAWRYFSASNEWQYSNDGTTFQPFGTGSGLTASTGVEIVTGDIRLNIVAANSGLEIDSGEVQVDHAAFQDSDFVYDSTDAGSADAYEVGLIPAVTVLTEGLEFSFKAANTNTGASTIDVDGLGAVAIKKNVSLDLVAGDILTGGIIKIFYDGTIFQMLNPVANTSGGDNPFGGDGSDGPLNVTSGTTSISSGIKNYTSINIAAGATLTLSGSGFMYLKSQGNVTINGTIDLDGKGAPGGAARNVPGLSSASAGLPGTTATQGIDFSTHNGGGGAAAGVAAGGGGGGGSIIAGTVGSTSGSGTGGTAGAILSNLAAKIATTYINYRKMFNYAGGSGAGSGGAATGPDSGSTALSGAGGAAGAGLIIECAGALDFSGTGVITSDGENGGNGSGTVTHAAAGGGGGSAGTILIMYNTLTDNSGSITVTAGIAGSGSTGGGGSAGPGGAGSDGHSLIMQNQAF